jgi:hypothetical protein
MCYIDGRKNKDFLKMFELISFFRINKLGMGDSNLDEGIS